MNMAVRLRGCSVALLCGLLAWPAPGADAAGYPDRRVTIVVGAAAGAGGDLLVRLLAQKLSDRWKQTVIVENKSGGSGLIAANEALKSPADGYTLFVSNDSPAINPNVQSHMPFDYSKVFEPISLLVLIDFKLLVRPDLAAKSVSELIALGKSSPGKLTFASAGVFTSHHLMSELFRTMAGFDAVHVPFRGAAPATTSVIAGRTDYEFTGFTGISSFIEAGQLRELATTGTARNAASPLLPTVGEALSGFSAYAWFAMWTRAEVPSKIRSQIAADVASVMTESDVIDRLKGLGMQPIGGTPDGLRAFRAQEEAKWATLPLSIREQR
jgi:tripartite-type tricarboxylate transporter receptor subunit TctC